MFIRFITLHIYYKTQQIMNREKEFTLQTGRTCNQAKRCCRLHKLPQFWDIRRRRPRSDNVVTCGRVPTFSACCCRNCWTGRTCNGYTASTNLLHPS